MPDPEPNDDNQVLSFFKIIPESPDILADGVVPVITIHGVYVYHLRVPLSIRSGKLFLGANPAVLIASANLVLRADMFSKEILQPSQAGS